MSLSLLVQGPYIICGYNIKGFEGSIGGLAVVAFWRSPHGPLGSGPPRAGYSQRRGKKREKREKEERKKGERRKKRKGKKRREEKEEDLRPI